METPRALQTSTASAGAARWVQRSRTAAAAIVLIGATFVSGPAAAARAETPVAAPAPASGARWSSESWSEEQLLGTSLATEYAGAVPEAEVHLLVHHVATRLRREGSPAEHLLRTTEAVCRRALTDHLARGTSLAAA